ncbi:HYR domain-containing protein [Aggregicoccus sp. 17bor-14]|uniref:ELWxxDGT repeat protein n=1 Tax=Myxococcaceae TaxID=31 RepID=UPI00129C25B8|nr:MULTISPECIES: ELWxxDGT repeat protein [Myxococcaceae]MBF5045251.1 HYR domain-containing protein [Simulacricoccus sp. 17bor-14]MRI90992.1 HYR domain-containing protein [Aggregicoccus sp. 17bor-14]
MSTLWKWSTLALLAGASSCGPQPEAPRLAGKSSALGTPAPLAHRVKDLNPGPGDGLPERLKPYFHLHALGHTLFLRADDGVSGPALWRSDGTEQGTRLVKDFTDDTADTLGDEPAVLGDALYFFAGPTSALGLWKISEDAESPELVQSLSPKGEGWAFSLRRFGTQLGFVHTDPDTGAEPWVSDGTTDGTHLVVDVWPGAKTSDPRFLRDLNGTLFFTAEDSVHGRELWRSDGSAGGTRLVKDIRSDGDGVGAYSAAPVAVGNALYFAADDGTGACGLWRTDGSELGTVPVKVFGDDCLTDGVEDIVASGSRVFFMLRHRDAEARQLWRTDGTPESTVLLLDTLPGAGPTIFGGLIAHGAGVLFVGPGSAGGTALWRSDGTQAGTVRVKDVAVSADNFYGYQILDGLLVFRGDDGVHGQELWRSDGTPEGTFMVSDVRPGPESSGASHFALAGDTLYFRATDGVSGYEPWAIPMAKVHDPIPPTLTCPADVAVNASQPLNINVNYPPAQASDNSGESVTLTYSQASGSTFPEGATQVVVTATDAVKNTASCSFRVTVYVGMPYGDDTLDDGGPLPGSGCASTAGSPGAWLAALSLLVLRGRWRAARRS